MSRRFLERTRHLELPSQTARMDEVAACLSFWEIPWREKQKFLESRGYMLRPRFHPEWVPSWRLLPGLYGLALETAASNSEDGHKLEPIFSGGASIDATRMSDGKQVCIKVVETNNREMQIALYLTSLHDPKNHCVPILDIMQDEDDDLISYLVMPFLCELNDPPFENVGEFLDFGDQILEGLAFMHEHGVVHRDCFKHHIMMDASAMYPRGFYPPEPSQLPDYSGDAPVIPRSIAGAKYYIIDFGLALYYAPDTHPRLIAEMVGTDASVPELSWTIPFDPFKAEMFVIGNMFRHEFIRVYSNLGLVVPIIESLTQRDPTARPDAPEALRQWRAATRNVSFFLRNCRLQKRNCLLGVGIVLDAFQFLKTGISWLRYRDQRVRQ